MDDDAEQRLLPLVSRFYRDQILKNFEGVFVFSILALLAFIVYVCDHRLTFLNLYFIPVLLAGYFLNARSAVLGSVLSILIVGFFAARQPESFMQEMNSMTLYLYLVAWGSILVLTGALVGTMTEQLRVRFSKARRSLEQLGELQDELKSSNQSLSDKNLSLEGMKTKVEAALHYTMDPVVAKLVINGQLLNEKREISVLFADLDNFTSHMENVPAEVSIRDLNRLFSSMEPILAVHKGHLDKYIGDGLMAEFGMPYFSEQQAVLAALAGLRMQARMAQRDFPWKMRVGIATGSALVGLMGSENRKNYTAIGSTVHAASLLKEKCPIGGVCVDGRTHAAIARWFRTRRIRTGLSPHEARRLEDNLDALDELLLLAPKVEHCLRAAEICALLGEPARATSYERRALELEPESEEKIQRSMMRVVIAGTEHAAGIQGRSDTQAAFEVLGLKDPLDEVRRIPRSVAATFEEMAALVRLPEDAVLPLEAAQGSLGHGKVVAALSAALAHALGLSERERRDAFLAGYVHDIGKRNVPAALLAKQARMEELTPADQESLRSHVQEAQNVMRDLGLPVSETLVSAVQQHHERFDGGGHPRGLKGEDISLLARVIQIADEYEALTAWRPHHEPWAPTAALAELEKDTREGKFDPKVEEVFRRMMRGSL